MLLRLRLGLQLGLLLAGRLLLLLGVGEVDAAASTATQTACVTTGGMGQDVITRRAQRIAEIMGNVFKAVASATCCIMMTLVRVIYVQMGGHRGPVVPVVVWPTSGLVTCAKRQCAPVRVKMKARALLQTRAHVSPATRAASARRRCAHPHAVTTEGVWRQTRARV